MGYMLKIAAAAVLICSGLWTASDAAMSANATPETPGEAGRFLVRLSLELATDTSPEEAEERDREIDLLHEEIVAVQEQRRLVLDFLEVPPDVRYEALPAAEGNSAIDYLHAMRQSYARFNGARDAGDRNWTSKQLTAAQRYAALASAALVAEALIAEERAVMLHSKQFAIRRSSAQGAAALEEANEKGLSDVHREMLRKGGLVDQRIDLIDLMVQFTPAGELGLSAMEGYVKIAYLRCALADWLEEFVQNPVPEPTALSHSFVVGNPTDQDAAIDLYIRPVSISPQWRLSIIDATEATPGEQEVRPHVQEVKPGEHYRVRLPAGGETRVTSVLLPVGPVGPNTTARWAVEGKIGGELIGGMMHEMHVPGVLDDLQLPPISPAATPATLEAVSSFPHLVWILGVVLLVIAVAAVIFTRRALRSAEPESKG